jgi:uncharacterized membrane protein
MRGNNRGQVLVLVALAFVAFIGFAALAVDVAYMYSVRNELQRCADAGALAGASAFVDPSVGNAVLRSTAEERARTFASRNTVSGSPLNGASDVDVAVSLPDNLVRVTTDCTVNLFFARIFGKGSTTIHAVAAANHLPSDNTLRLVE